MGRPEGGGRVLPLLPPTRAPRAAGPRPVDPAGQPGRRRHPGRGPLLRRRAAGRDHRVPRHPAARRGGPSTDHAAAARQCAGAGRSAARITSPPGSSRDTRALRDPCASTLVGLVLPAHLYPGQTVATMAHLVAFFLVGLVVVIVTRGRLGIRTSGPASPAPAPRSAPASRGSRTPRAADAPGSAGSPPPGNRW